MRNGWKWARAGAALAALAVAALAAPEAHAQQAPAAPTGLSVHAANDSVLLLFDDPGDNSITAYVYEIREFPGHSWRNNETLVANVHQWPADSSKSYIKVSTFTNSNGDTVTITNGKQIRVRKFYAKNATGTSPSSSDCNPSFCLRVAADTTPAAPVQGNISTFTRGEAVPTTALAASVCYDVPCAWPLDPATPMPAGLTYNSTTRAITGTPSAEGATAIRYRAVDDNGSVSAYTSLTLTVHNPIGVKVAAGAAVTEGMPAVFTLTLSMASDAALLVNYRIGESDSVLPGGRAADYTVTFPVGLTESVVRVPTVNDSTHEDDGSVTLTILSGSGYSRGTPYTASVAVKDNDPPEVVMVVGQSGSDAGYRAGAGGYGTISGTYPPLLFLDGAARTPALFYQDGDGELVLSYTAAGAPDGFKDNPALAEIALRVTVGGALVTEFLLGPHIVDRATRQIQVDPPYAGLLLAPHNTATVTVAFVEYPPASEIQDDTAPPADTVFTPGKIVVWLEEYTPGGGIGVQAMVTLMVLMGALLKGRKQNGGAWWLAALLILTPWIPARLGLGHEIMAFLLTLSTVGGVFIQRMLLTDRGGPV